ncbi:hypothetical protein ACQI4L_24195 [Mycolicibacterium litorale]|uniref:hypothetical protein n=1 Tax=Mycolicibacterium litorale TaxID=758802 RepID=UPI003CF368B9
MNMPPQGTPGWSSPQGWYPPPQGWPPQGPPPQWGPPQGPPWPPPRPPSNNSLVIVLAVAAVVVVLLSVAALVVVGVGADDEDGPATEEQRAANARTASSASEYDIVCGTGSVANAAEYRKPYKIVAFYEDHGDHWDELSLAPPYSTADKTPSSINVVACLSRKPGTEVKSGSCEFRSGGDDISVDHFAVEYEIELHEAKTGRTITSLGTVKGPADHCPFLEFFSGDDPKVYGAPDENAVAAKLAGFIAE